MALLIFAGLQEGDLGYLPFVFEVAGERVAVARPRVRAMARMLAVIFIVGGRNVELECREINSCVTNGRNWKRDQLADNTWLKVRWQGKSRAANLTDLYRYAPYT